MMDFKQAIHNKMMGITIGRTITKLELETRGMPETGFYITQRCDLLVRVDSEGYATCYDLKEGEQMELDDGDMSTPWSEVLIRTIGDVRLHKIMKLTFPKGLTVQELDHD